MGWGGPRGDYSLPLTALLRCCGRARIDIWLRPTGATDVEQAFVIAAGNEVECAVDTARDGRHPAVQRVGPAAALASRAYGVQFRRLHEPFLVAVRCHADEEEDALTLAGAFEAVGSEGTGGVNSTDVNDLPCLTEVRKVNGNDGFPAVWSSQPRFLERLPYLTDASGVATVFRFPVSVQGGVPGIAVRQASPDFDPGPPQWVLHGDVPPKEVSLGVLEQGRKMTIPLDDLTKHVLITGFTGTGKTWTVLSLLKQLWTYQIPFLVLESAKQEYRGLLGVSGLEMLQVFTVGNARGLPLRINPFELLDGVRVESHIASLQVCFEAAIPPVGPSSSVIAEALDRVYYRHGWSMWDQAGSMDQDGGDHARRRPFPTVAEFISEVEQVILSRGYKGDLENNLKAAICGRLRPLLLGSKNLMFSCRQSSPSIDAMMTKPTLLELNDLGLNDKALVVMFVLTFLREYRESQQSTRAASGLVHVTVVEEAHNVLADVVSQGQGEGSGADTRHKAVESFCQLLTEIRALGEGLVIADQSPQKLARDAIRNTNLQIAHQLRDSGDREAIARAMLMTDEQRDYLGKLNVGQAAMYRTGLERATFIKVPPFLGNSSAPGAGFLENLSTPDLRQRRKTEDSPPFDGRGCEQCRARCHYRSDAQTFWNENQLDVRARLGSAFSRKSTREERLDAVARMVHEGLRWCGYSVELADPWLEKCMFLHLWFGYMPNAQKSPDFVMVDAAFKRVRNPDATSQ